METNNLWPDFKPADVRTTKRILKEQAGYLATKTNGILYAEVTTTSVDEAITHTLTVVAPAVNNYRYKLLTVQHDIDFYPAVIFDFSAGREIGVHDEPALIDWLRIIFNSKESVKVINSLLQLSSE